MIYPIPKLVKSYPQHIRALLAAIIKLRGDEMDIKNYKILNFRRKFWKLVGAEISVMDESATSEVAVIKMKAWKLKEDVRLFPDRDFAEGTELLRIHARSIIDIGATYDVFIGKSTELSFSLRRKGLRSIFVRDKWLILDKTGSQTAELNETSSGLALFRRYIEIIPYLGPVVAICLSFIKQTYEIQDISNACQAKITHQRNPFIVKMQLDQTMSSLNYDPLIGLSATAMLCVVDAIKS